MYFNEIFIIYNIFSNTFLGHHNCYYILENYIANINTLTLFLPKPLPKIIAPFYRFVLRRWVILNEPG